MLKKDWDLGIAREDYVFKKCFRQNL